MHIAAASGYDEVVEYLLDHGAKIDVVDHDKWQPIHAAACWGHVCFNSSAGGCFLLEYRVFKYLL